MGFLGRISNPRAIASPAENRNFKGTVSPDYNTAKIKLFSSRKQLENFQISYLPYLNIIFLKIFKIVQDLQMKINNKKIHNVKRQRKASQCRVGHTRQLLRQSGTRDNCCNNLAPATIAATICHPRQLLCQSGTRDHCCYNLAPATMAATICHPRQLLRQSGTRNNCCDNLPPATIAATICHLRQLLRQSGTRDNCFNNLVPATIAATIWHPRQLLRQSGTRDNCCNLLAPATIAAAIWHP